MSAKLDDVSESILYSKAVDVLVKLHKTDLAIDLYIYDQQKLLDEVCASPAEQFILYFLFLFFFLLWKCVKKIVLTLFCDEMIKTY